MDDSTGTCMVHVGSAAAQKHIYPIGKTAKVTPVERDLLNDLRQAACEFGAETDSTEIPHKFEAMQMRMHEVAKRFEAALGWAGVFRDTTMKF